MGLPVKEVKSVRHYKAGYEVREEVIDGTSYGCPDTVMKSAYTPSGDYIGDSKTAYRLCKKRGIKPELRTPSSNVCSIGFCEAEQKWYGWSHRAIWGFGIGDTIGEGSIVGDDYPYLVGTTAENLDDCRGFACMFAEGVS